MDIALPKQAYDPVADGAGSLKDVRGVRQYITHTYPGTDSAQIIFHYALRNRSDEHSHRILWLPRKRHGITPGLNVQGAKNEHLVVVDSETNIAIARRYALHLRNEAEHDLAKAKTLYASRVPVLKKVAMPKPGDIAQAIQIAPMSMPMGGPQTKDAVTAVAWIAGFAAALLVKHLNEAGLWNAVLKAYTEGHGSTEEGHRELEGLPSAFLSTIRGFENQDLSSRTSSHQNPLPLGGYWGRVVQSVIRGMWNTDVKHFAEACRARLQKGDRTGTALLDLTTSSYRLMNYLSGFGSTYIPFVSLPDPIGPMPLSPATNGTDNGALLGGANPDSKMPWVFLKETSKPLEGREQRAREPWTRRAWEIVVKVLCGLHPVTVGLPLNLRFPSSYFHFEFPPGVGICYGPDHLAWWLRPRPVLPSLPFSQRRIAEKKLRILFDEDDLGTAGTPKRRGDHGLWESFQEDRSYTFYRNQKQLLRYTHVVRPSTPPELPPVDGREALVPPSRGKRRAKPLQATRRPYPELPMRIWTSEQLVIQLMSLLFAFSALVTLLQFGGLLGSSFPFLSIMASVGIAIVVMVQSHELSRNSVIARVFILMFWVFAAGVFIHRDDVPSWADVLRAFFGA